MRSACSHPWQDSNLQPHVEIHARVGVKVRRRIQRCLWDAEPTGQAGGPFASQDGIEVVGPLALGPGALQQVALAPHAHPLQHGGRAHVAIVAGRPDSMLASLDEQVVQQPGDRLGGVAVALMLGDKGEADLGLARILGLDVGPTVADQSIRLAQGHGELEPLAGPVGMDDR